MEGVAREDALPKLHTLQEANIKLCGLCMNAVFSGFPFVGGKQETNSWGFCLKRKESFENPCLFFTKRGFVLKIVKLYRCS